MKKFILFFIVFMVVGSATIKFIAIPRAEKNILSSFEQFGFKDITAENTKLSLKGIMIENLSLDKDGFNKAKNIRANISWPTYLIGGALSDIKIEQLSLSAVIDRPNDILHFKKYLTHKYLKNISNNNITIEALTIDVALPKKALRFNGDVNISKENDSGARVIKANINPSQHDLSFDSQWQAEVNKDGTFIIENLFSGLAANTPIGNIKRGTGFISFARDKDDNLTITSQFDAGSGHILNFPFKDINFILTQTEQGYPATLRAKAAHINDVNLYGDFVFSKIPSKQQFDIVLDTHNPNKFINYLKQYNSNSAIKITI